MKNRGNELDVVGHPISNSKMVDYILVGLDRDYHLIVAAVGAIKTFITIDGLLAQISAFDQRVDMLGDGPCNGFNTSANATYRGHGQNRGRGVGAEPKDTA
jgi:hypothetical protein